MRRKGAGISLVKERVVFGKAQHRVLLAVSPLKPRKQGFGGLDNGLC